jgi:hypothetical protein
MKKELPNDLTMTSISALPFFLAAAAAFSLGEWR